MNNVSIKLLNGEREEMTELQRVLESAPDYSQRITGVPPGKADAQSTFSALPEGKTYEDKFVYGVYASGEMVGCIDLIRGYPNEPTAFLGLLMLSEHVQRQGIGAIAYQLAEKEMLAWKTCNKIRLAVVKANDIVLPFWKKQGFRETGEIKPYKYNHVISESILMEKAI